MTFFHFAVKDGKEVKDFFPMFHFFSHFGGERSFQ